MQKSNEKKFELDESYAWDYLVIQCCNWLSKEGNQKKALEFLRKVVKCKDEKDLKSLRVDFSMNDRCLDATFRERLIKDSSYFCTQETFGKNFCRGLKSGETNKEFDEEVKALRDVFFKNWSNSKVISDSANKYFYNGEYNCNNQSNYAPQQENCLIY